MSAQVAMRCVWCCYLRRVPPGAAAACCCAGITVVIGLPRTGVVQKGREENDQKIASRERHKPGEGGGSEEGVEWQQGVGRSKWQRLKFQVRDHKKDCQGWWCNWELIELRAFGGVGEVGVAGNPGPPWQCDCPTWCGTSWNAKFEGRWTCENNQ